MSFLPGPAGERPQLAELIRTGDMVLAPGCYDPLGARLIQEAGFPAVYMTGFGTAAGRLGRPDVGLLTLSEMVDNARRIADAVDVPVIADADTGYGNPINVIRTVREYEAAGVAAIHLEDQVTPKKCGHMDDKQLIGAGEMTAKVSAAVAARRSDDFLIIARTDARSVEGLDGALARGERYRAAGADILFIEAPQTRDEIKRIEHVMRESVDQLRTRAEPYRESASQQIDEAQKYVVERIKERPVIATMAGLGVGLLLGLLVATRSDK